MSGNNNPEADKDAKEKEAQDKASRDNFLSRMLGDLWEGITSNLFSVPGLLLLSVLGYFGLQGEGKDIFDKLSNGLGKLLEGAKEWVPNIAETIGNIFGVGKEWREAAEGAIDNIAAWIGADVSGLLKNSAEELKAMKEVKDAIGEATANAIFADEDTKNAFVALVRDANGIAANGAIPKDSLTNAKTLFAMLTAIDVNLKTAVNKIIDTFAVNDGKVEGATAGYLATFREIMADDANVLKLFHADNKEVMVKLIGKFTNSADAEKQYSSMRKLLIAADEKSFNSGAKGLLIACLTPDENGQMPNMNDKLTTYLDTDDGKNNPVIKAALQKVEGKLVGVLGTAVNAKAFAEIFGGKLVALKGALKNAGLDLDAENVSLTTISEPQKKVIKKFMTDNVDLVKLFATKVGKQSIEAITNEDLKAEIKKVADMKDEQVKAVKEAVEAGANVGAFETWFVIIKNEEGKETLDVPATLKNLLDHSKEISADTEVLSKLMATKELANGKTIPQPLCRALLTACSRIGGSAIYKNAIADNGRPDAVVEVLAGVIDIAQTGDGDINPLLRIAPAKVTAVFNQPAFALGVRDLLNAMEAKSGSPLAYIKANYDPENSLDNGKNDCKKGFLDILNGADSWNSNIIKQIQEMQKERTVREAKLKAEKEKYAQGIENINQNRPSGIKGYRASWGLGPASSYDLSAEELHKKIEEVNKNLNDKKLEAGMFWPESLTRNVDILGGMPNIPALKGNATVVRN